MGITSSKSSSSSYDKLRDQLSRIGDQNPFGDDEIMRLSRCMAYLHACSNYSKSYKNDGLDRENLSRRWLTDLAVFCSTLPPADFSTDVVSTCHVYNDLLQLDSNLLKRPLNDDDDAVLETRKTIKFIMTVIEEHVLPPDFGRVLYERYFALLTPSPSMTEYDQDSPIEAQRKIAWERLEKFINGASETSRRGSRKGLTCLFKCCTKDLNSSEADAKELLDCVYRLSLACAIYSRYMANQAEITFQNQNRLTNNKEVMEKEGNETHDAPDSKKKENEVSTNEENDDELAEIPIFDPSTLFPLDVDKSLVTSLLDHESKEFKFGMASMIPPLETENSHAGNDGKVSLNTFLDWAETCAPCLSSCLETFMHHVLFPDKPYPPSRSEFIFPNLRGQHSAFFRQEASPLLFSFAAMSPSLGGAWHRLYTSDSDGLSFNRLQNALLGYSGPTLMIIKEAENGCIFGAKTSTAWKESKDFYGNSDCFLFTIKPTMKVMRPRGNGTNYMYCNSISRSRGYDGLAHGIGFGGNSEKPRLFISETFDGCMAGASDLTFEAGQMLHSQRDDGSNPTKYFDLEALEVWGVGGDAVVSEALGNRHKQREIVASNIRKARKVDKAQFLDDFKSGLIESKAFRHRDEIRGRGDCHIDDRDENNYVYD